MFRKSQQSDLIAETTLYAHHLNHQKMIEQIDSYVRTPDKVIYIILFRSIRNGADCFEDNYRGEFNIKPLYRHEDIYIGEINRKYGRDGKKAIGGKFLLFRYEQTDYYLALTHEGTSFFENGLGNYIRKKYPSFALPFFYSWEIESMLNVLARATPLNNIMLTKVSRKSRLTGGGSRKAKESDLMWTDLPYKEIFKETRQNNAWVEKAYFELVPEVKSKPSILNGFISRRGFFKCEKNFKLFFEAIIGKAIEIAYKREGNFKNRERNKKTNYESKPLALEFDEAVFQDKRQNAHLVDVLKNIPHSVNSVIHGNPYLHVMFTDYIDNSNYDIWVLSDSRITIVPQAVCTINSLNRLCEHISKEFREGEIKDLREIKE